MEQLMGPCSGLQLMVRKREYSYALYENARRSKAAVAYIIMQSLLLDARIRHIKLCTILPDGCAVGVEVGRDAGDTMYP